MTVGRVLLLAVAVLLCIVVVRVVGSPVLRRLALRNASRRPREALLVVLGSLLGTAIITGSLVVGDTLKASIRRSAFTQLGPVDEVVRTSGPEVAATAEAAARALPGGDVDGVLRLVSLNTSVAAGGQQRAEPHANVYEVDFGAGRRFGGDVDATGLEGETPLPGQAVVGEDLAEALNVRAGQRVVVHAYGTSVELEVRRQVPRLGIAGLSFGQASESPNLFVTPGTIARLQGRGSTGQGSPPSSLVLVSNRGGVIEGADRSDSVTPALERALAGTPATVQPVKRDVLKAADSAGKDFTELFGGIGFFSVLAGILLVVNIFVMLVEERKVELGMLRAVGLRRSGLRGAFSLEGCLYALAAAALGSVAGLGVGRVIVMVATGIFGTGDFALELDYTAEPASIVQGLVIGFVISVVTVVLTALWVSRLNVIRAIRDLPEPEGRGQRLVFLVLGALALVIGGALTITGIGGADPYAALAGPTLAGYGSVPLLGRFVPRRALVSAVSVGILAWAVLAFDVIPEAFRDADIPVFVEQGVILTVAAVALVSPNQDLIGGLVRRLGGGSGNMALRLGLAYPLARRFRTGMIISMYALVVFTLTFITVFSHLFQGQLDDFTRRMSGGFDLQVSSSGANPVPLQAVAETPGVDGVAGLAVVEGQWERRRAEGFKPWPLAGFDQALVDRGPPGLEERDRRFPDDLAAYRAVLADPSLVIVSEFFLEEGGGPAEAPPRPGDQLILRDPLSGRSRQVTIAALANASFANIPVALTSRRAVDEIFGPVATTNNLYVSTTAGTDPEELAEQLNGRFVANGADAESFRKTVDQGMAQQQQFFRLMQGYLALGLVIGIAGLGVVMVRAVRERRRQVGVLRSLGFPAAAVRRAFLAESAFVSLEGILVGCVLALITAWRLISNETFGSDLAFRVPWAQLALLVAGTFVASMVATATPAQQASRIRPAVALRIAD